MYNFEKLCKAVKFFTAFQEYTMLTVALSFPTAISASLITMIWVVFWLIVVAILWGATNPLMKKGGAGIENIHEDGAIKQYLAEIRFLVCNWKVSIIEFRSTHL